MLKKEMGHKVMKVNSLGNNYDEHVQVHIIQHNGLLKDENMLLYCVMLNISEDQPDQEI
jgi:hypothetical protein